MSRNRLWFFKIRSANVVLHATNLNIRTKNITLLESAKNVGSVKPTWETSVKEELFQEAKKIPAKIFIGIGATAFALFASYIVELKKEQRDIVNHTEEFIDSLEKNINKIINDKTPLGIHNRIEILSKSEELFSTSKSIFELMESVNQLEEKLNEQKNVWFLAKDGIAQKRIYKLLSKLGECGKTLEILFNITVGLEKFSEKSYDETQKFFEKAYQLCEVLLEIPSFEKLQDGPQFKIEVFHNTKQQVKDSHSYIAEEQKWQRILVSIINGFALVARRKADLAKTFEEEQQFYKQAIKYFDICLDKKKLSSKNAVVMANKVGDLRRTGQNSEVLTIIDEAMRTSPHDPVVLNQYALCLSNKNFTRKEFVSSLELNEILKYFNYLIEKYPNNYILLNNRGFIYSLLAHHEKDILDNIGFINNFLSLILRKEDKVKKFATLGLQDLDAAVFHKGQFYKEDNFILFNRASIKILCGDYNGALEDIEKIVKIDGGKSLHVQYAKAIVLLYKGRRNEALEILSKAKEKAKENERFFVMSDEYFETSDDFIRKINEAEKADPTKFFGASNPPLLFKQIKSDSKYLPSQKFENSATTLTRIHH